MNFVFTLSKGKETRDTLTPDTAEAASLIVIVYFFYPVKDISFSLTSLYDTSWLEFKDMALKIVGTAPVQSPRTPSSAAILLKASMTFL